MRGGNLENNSSGADRIPEGCGRRMCLCVQYLSRYFLYMWSFWYCTYRLYCVRFVELLTCWRLLSFWINYSHLSSIVTNKAVCNHFVWKHVCRKGCAAQTQGGWFAPKTFVTVACYHMGNVVSYGAYHICIYISNMILYISVYIYI